MTTDVSGRVAFDQEVEVARGGVVGYGGVRAEDLLLRGLAGFWVYDGEGCGEGDVLACWEAEDGCWGWEGETVDGCVVGEDGFFC